MVRDEYGVLVLNKLTISTREVIVYLESIDISNKQILQVLMKKPALPDYGQLPWVKGVEKDMVITKKLKSKSKLNIDEKTRLKNILEDALTGLRKINRMQRVNRGLNGLEVYIQKFL